MQNGFLARLKEVNVSKELLLKSNTKSQWFIDVEVAR